MIESIGIKNYKSIVDLQFDVGRVNILIGENGSGKSNILEAIALAAAAEANKLDNEFLTSRGIRVTSPLLMRSNFVLNNQHYIETTIKFNGIKTLYTYELKNSEAPYSKWSFYRYKNSTNNDFREADKEGEKEGLFGKEIANIAERISAQLLRYVGEEQLSLDNLEAIVQSQIREIQSLNESQLLFKDTIIYSPEETALRNLYREGQIEPLGIHGEGLLKLIKVLDDDNSDISVRTIKATLSALGWFEDIDVLNSEVGFADEENIRICDRFTKSWFDQRSANKGFLFVLFYTALMVSKDTPSIFAIDNVDASLNPKLCTKIVSDIVRLAKQFDKQCFLTAHNPAVLDGIDLGDDEQRLVVVSRNRKGHTRIKRITLEDKPASSTGEDLKLSEAFLRGYLGGLPKNF